MRPFWRWLERNSAQLQGLAAVAGILGALAAIPYFASKWFAPDLTVVVTSDEATTPPALKDWIHDIALDLKSLPEAEKDQEDPYSSLRKWQVTGPLEPVRFETYRWDNMGRIRVDVTNQTDRVLPGIRLRFDDAWPVWGVEMAATFSTAEEIARWKKNLSREPSGPTLVLPELPPLPPNGSVSLVAYGDVTRADISVAAPGSSFKLVKTVKVQDKFPISAILRPYWLPLAFSVILIFILGMLSGFERWVWRRARRNITYGLACGEAKAGRKESALRLLEASVAAGYRNFNHMRADEDLASLRGLDKFRNICGLRGLPELAGEATTAPNTGPQADA